jgi:hypothetical protein
MNNVIKTQWAVYRYDSLCYPDGLEMPLAQYRPKEGEMLVIKNTPYFAGYPILIHGYANKTVAELVQAAAAAASPGDIINALSALQTLINNVEQIALGASVSLVFDNRAQLDAWMGGAAVPGALYTPDKLRVGWKALMRAEDESDWWWDGAQWLIIETDLSPYLTAEEIYAVFAPIRSPVFTGIPQAPHPDYMNLISMAQIPTVRALVQVREILAMTILRWVRSTHTPPPEGSLFPKIRVTRDGLLRGIIREKPPFRCPFNCTKG